MSQDNHRGSSKRNPRTNTYRCTSEEKRGVVMLRFPAVMFQKLDWAHICGSGLIHLDHTLIPSQANLGQADVQILFSFRTTIRGLAGTVE